MKLLKIQITLVFKRFLGYWRTQPVLRPFEQVWAVFSWRTLFPSSPCYASIMAHMFILFSRWFAKRPRLAYRARGCSLSGRIGLSNQLLNRPPRGLDGLTSSKKGGNNWPLCSRDSGGLLSLADPLFPFGSTYRKWPRARGGMLSLENLTVFARSLTIPILKGWTYGPEKRRKLYFRPSLRHLFSLTYLTAESTSKQQKLVSWLSNLRTVWLYCACLRKISFPSARLVNNLWANAFSLRSVDSAATTGEPSKYYEIWYQNWNCLLFWLSARELHLSPFQSRSYRGSNSLVEKH